MSIKEIAKMTGASESTVGRILSNPNHKCRSEELKNQILEAARQLNYIPNEAARSLRQGKKKQEEVYLINILLTRVVSEENDPFYSEMLRLVEVEIRKNNGIVANIWHNTDFSNEKYCTYTKAEMAANNFYADKDKKYSGLIIIGKCCTKAIQALRKHEKNIISINRNSTNYQVDEVLCDGAQIAQIALEHLIQKGHRKIGYVGECHQEVRFVGYQQTLIKYQLIPDIDYIFDVSPNETNGYEAMEYFAQQADPPTAIFCAHDILAIGLLKYLTKHKSRYYNPSVISSDNIAEAQYTSPMLTTVSLPKEEMARFALMILMDRINGGHQTISKVQMEGKLVVRDSVRDANEIEYYI